jgi:serine protease Do
VAVAVAVAVVVLLWVVLFATRGGSRGSPPLSPEQVFYRARPAVGMVTSASTNTGMFRSLGSGFLVRSDGVMVTNHHVIKDADVFFVRLHDGTSASARLLLEESRRDLALLKLDGVSYPSLELTRTLPPVGATVYALGNPAGLEATYTSGMVSAIRDGPPQLPGRLIQNTAPISPGSSGGPLLDAEGRVVGVTTLGTNTAELQGVYLAVPAEDIAALLDRAVERGLITSRQP